jgi:hypothetical protein
VPRPLGNSIIYLISTGCSGQTAAGRGMGHKGSNKKKCEIKTSVIRVCQSWGSDADWREPCPLSLMFCRGVVWALSLFVPSPRLQIRGGSPWSVAKFTGLGGQPLHHIACSAVDATRIARLSHVSKASIASAKVTSCAQLASRRNKNGKSGGFEGSRERDLNPFRLLSRGRLGSVNASHEAVSQSALL